MATEKNSWYREVNPLHYIYIIIALVLTVILVIAYRSSDNAELVKLVSFAGTITSIILSVIAIFMTILSNDSLGGTLNKIRDVSDSIHDVPTLINESVGNMQEISALLKNTIDDMKTHVSNLALRVETVDDHISEAKEHIQLLVSLNTKVEHKDSQEDNVVQLQERVVNYASYIGLLLIYSLIESTNKGGGRLNLDTVSGITSTSYDYLQGYLVALASSGIVEYDGTDPKNLSNIRVIQEIDVDRVLEQLRIKAQMISEKLSIENDVENMIQSIDALFNNRDSAE